MRASAYTYFKPVRGLVIMPLEEAHQQARPEAKQLCGRAGPHLRETELAREQRHARVGVLVVMPQPTLRFICALS